MGIIAASRLRGVGLFKNSEAYYKCDGTTSGVLLDSKNSFNGTLNGGITQGVTGKIASAVESDGTSLSYLSIPRDTFNENDFSLSFWFYYDTVYSGLSVILRNEKLDRSGNGGFAVNLGDNQSVVVFDDSVYASYNDTYLLNSWNNIIIQKSNTIQVFVNNVSKVNISTQDYSQTIAGDLFFGVSLGLRGEIRVNTSRKFLVDEIDIRKEQYTQQQRDELYNNGNGTTI
jgi:hypothetical protein